MRRLLEETASPRARWLWLAAIGLALACSLPGLVRAQSARIDSMAGHRLLEDRHAQSFERRANVAARLLDPLRPRHPRAVRPQRVQVPVQV